MKTETEAKECECPVVGIGLALMVNALNSGAPVELGPTSHTTSQCMASRCMMWRWASHDEHDVDTGKRVYEACGFCGLAGYPLKGVER